MSPSLFVAQIYKPLDLARTCRRHNIRHGEFIFSNDVGNALALYQPSVSYVSVK
jgi:hypothetical protein